MQSTGTWRRVFAAIEPWGGRVFVRLPSVLLLALAVDAVRAAPAHAAQLPDVVQPTSVSWMPERPVQGTLFRLLVSPAAGVAIAGVSGSLAGEPLHFAVRSDGAAVTLAALPVDARDSVTFTLQVDCGDGALAALPVTIRVAAGAYRLERLTVAPQFGTAPDSATQARIRREQAKALAVSRRSHETPQLWDGRVQLPREARVTSGFGHGREFNGQVQSRHMGTDFAGAVGSPVRASARGVVALVDTFHLAGNVIYIDHGRGLVSAYFHLSRQEVAPGDTVQPGQLIGRVGATGRVTAPHLHWTVRYGAITVDPLSLVALAAADSAAAVAASPVR